MSWQLNPDPFAPDRMTPGDFHLAHNGTELTARLIFRRLAPAATPHSILATKAAQETRVRLGDTPARRRVAELQAREAELQVQLRQADEKLAAIAAKKADPSLLVSGDLGKVLLKLDREAEAAEAMKAEAQAALSAVSKALAVARQAAEAEAGQLAEALVIDAHTELLARRETLLARLAEAAGGILDELAEVTGQLAPPRDALVAEAQRLAQVGAPAP